MYIVFKRNNQEFHFDDVSELENCLDEDILIMEAEDLPVVQDVAALIAALNFINEDYSKHEAFCEWLKNVSQSDRTEEYVENFTEAYRGQYSSGGAYAKEQMEDHSRDLLSNIDPSLYACIDWEKYYETNYRYDGWESNNHYFRD